MKKVFLRITPSDKPNKDLKILNLCYWPKNFRKDNYTLNYKNFFKTQNNKNRIKNLKLAHQISIKIIKFLYKQISKKSNFKFSKEEYELIFYQFIISFTYMIIDRKLMIDEFFLNKKIKKFIANKIYQNKDEFICNSTIEFLILHLPSNTSIRTNSGLVCIKFLVKLACWSISITKILAPYCHSLVDKPVAIAVFPTPPFAVCTHIVWFGIGKLQIFLNS